VLSCVDLNQKPPHFGERQRKQSPEKGDLMHNLAADAAGSAAGPLPFRTLNVGTFPAINVELGPPGRQRWSQSFCSIALICTKSRRNPASARANQCPERGDLIAFARLAAAAAAARSSPQVQSLCTIQGYLAHKKTRPIYVGLCPWPCGSLRSTEVPLLL